MRHAVTAHSHVTGSDDDARQTGNCGRMLAMFALSGTVNVDEMRRGYVH